MNENGRKPLLQPTEEEKLFSQSDLHHIQRPAGVRGAVSRQDKTLQEYSGPRVTPAGWKEVWIFTVAAGAPQSFPFEEGLEFDAHSFLVDNWTNQWLYEDNLKRGVPPYSGGWVFTIPSAAQKASVRLRVPGPSTVYVPAAAIAGEYAWCAWSEAFLPPQTGIIDRTKAPVVA